MTSVREAHGTGVCEPAEQWREEGLQGRFGEHSPREDDQDARCDLEQCDERPGHDCRRRVERRAGHYGCEEFRVEGGHALGEPETGNFTEDDGYKGDGIFETGAIVDGCRVLVDKEETDKRHSQGSYKDLSY